MPPQVHSILGASSAHRWMNCTPSARLTERLEDKVTSFALEGSIAHELCEFKLKRALEMKNASNIKDSKVSNTTVANIQGRPCSPLIDEDMERYTDEYVDFILDLINVSKAQENEAPFVLIEQRLDYSRFVPEGYGTGDFICVRKNKLFVVDFKYGMGVKVHAEHNPQMMLYALGALELLGFLYDINHITMMIFQPRLHHYSKFEMTTKELLDWAENELRPKAVLASKGEGELASGEWCRFCKVRHTCRQRAKSNLELTKMEFAPPHLLSDSEIEKVLKKADDLFRWANDVYEYAKDKAVNKGKHWQGFKLVRGKTNRKFTDEKLVEEKVLRAGYEDIYKKSIISLTAFEKLLGKERFDEMLGSLVVRPEGKLTLVPIEDRRSEVIINVIDEEF